MRKEKRGWNKKTDAAQIELLVVLFFVAMASTLVIAVTNSTINNSFIQPISLNTIEKTAIIEVWANTSISVDTQGNIIKARLLLDNGTALQEQEIKFYLNNNFLNSKLTDSSGYAEINLNLSIGNHTIKAIFEGNSFLFLNPSEAVKEFEIKNVSETPLTEVNQTLLTVKTDKTNYTQNEIINIFGEILINGKKVDTEVNLAIDFNKTLIHSALVNASNGSYFYSLIADFENEGEYLIKALWENLTNLTRFYYFRENVTQNITENITANITLSIDASLSVENVTNTSLKSVIIIGSVYANESKIASNVSLIVKDSRGKIIYQEEKLTDGNFLFNFTFSPKLFGTYTVKISANTEYGIVSKNLTFDILKHKVIKAKIKQPKWNYALGEKIRFEINAIDEDGLLYPNATIRVFVIDPEGNVTEVNFTEDVVKGKYYVVLDTEREFRPGVHRLKVRLSYISPNPGEVVVEEEITFAVGLISINTKKSIYRPNETAEIIMVVLDKYGHLVSGANISLIVTNPEGKSSYFSTVDNITETRRGIYEASYLTEEEGNYSLFATAIAKGVKSTISSYFLVKEYYEFDILRDTPVTIDPKAGPFDSSIQIISYTNASSFTFKEYLPIDFEITNSNGAIITTTKDAKVLEWKNLENNTIVSYSAQAPLVWPYLYILGPAEITYDSPIKIFKEARAWQMAADPPGKADQYFVGNKTCEKFTDSISWSAVAPKSGTTSSYYNWTMGNPCPVAKNCDIFSIWAYVRYINAGAKESVVGAAYTQLANKTESDEGVYSRYLTYLNETVLAGDVLGPRWECGAGTTPTTCNTTGQGYDDSTRNYSVYLAAVGVTASYRMIIDDFNIQYEWCGIPIIYDANVSQETGGWGSKWDFTIKVTNPGDTTTVWLWRKQLGQEWQQVGSSQTCNDCANQTLNWTVDFVCSDIGEWLFKFNASDTSGNKAEASATSLTNECLDSGNDCTFEILKDNINITYVSGNGSTATLAVPAEFHLKVYDLTKGNDNISETLNVKFDVTDVDGGTFQYVGSNNTNSTGNVLFYFTPTGFTSGLKQWKGYVDTTSACYNPATSENFTVTVSVNNPPLYANESVLGITEGASASWGYPYWNFTVEVRDLEGDDLNISLKIKTTGADYVEIMKKSCTACSNWTQINFTNISFICNDVTDTAYYKFEVFDGINTNTTTPHQFTITRDNVAWEYFAGQDSIQNRSGSQTNLLSFRVKDANGTYLSNFATKFYVTKDNFSFVSDGNFEILTNGTGYANFNFNPTCAGDYAGAERFEVGEQQWKIKINDSELSCYIQNDSYSSIPRRLYVWGDIKPTLTKPKYHNETGGQNFTQEDIISFLGSTVDDCGLSLTLNTTSAAGEIKFYALHPEENYSCTENIELVGSNAYSCDLATSMSTKIGWYNLSIFTNKSYYYSNTTYKLGIPGVFYMNPLKRLASPLAVPTTEGWGYKNWNFSIRASSGDPTTTYNVSLYMGSTWPPLTKCESPTCLNGTPIECTGCIDSLKYWLRNFTNTDMGTWYYRFGMNGFYEETIKSVTVEKDDTNITYIAGNATTVIKDSQPQKLVVRVYDKDAETFSLSPSALVNFKAIHSSYEGGEKFIGSNYTNSTGYAEYYWNITDCNWYEGVQEWRAEINTTEPNYKNSSSINLTITIQLPGCVATVDVYPPIYTPTETFQYRIFKINATITAWITTAENVNVTLNAPSEWNIANRSQFLGNVSVGSYLPVSWEVNATTTGNFNVSVFANSTNAGNDTEFSSYFEVYKEKPPISFSDMPIFLAEGEEAIRDISCYAGDYRIALLEATWNASNTKVRVYVYNSTGFQDILHSYYVNTSGSLVTTNIPVLSEQLYTNETERCRIKIKNLGTSSINITSLSLEAYYKEAIKIIDIIPKIDNTVITGIEPDTKLFNISVKIANSINTTYSTTLYLNITNSTAIVNSSSQSVSIPASGSIEVNFTNINTTGWNEDIYRIKAYLSYNGKNESREEPFVYKYVVVSAKSADYICNGTTEEYNVEIANPFSDRIDYNVTMILPSGWSSQPVSQIVTANESRNYTASFNITSGQTAASPYINATVSYTYPIAKQKNVSKQIENGLIPILEIIRETPKKIGADKVFDSILVVHNKGCAATTGTTIVKEIVSAGWTPANPDVRGGYVTKEAATTDLINNILTWQLGSIGINRYAVLTYQIKAPLSEKSLGSLRYNATWDSRSLVEKEAFKIETFNYTGESHLEFDLFAKQFDVDYPWPENRSAQKGKNYNYSLVVKNIGDIVASGWNVTLLIPSSCNVTEIYNTTDNKEGSFDAAKRKITWELPSLSVYDSTYLNFTLNCSEEGKQVLVAEGIKDTRQETIFVNDTFISAACTSTPTASCSNTQAFVLSKPSSARYEKLGQIDFLIYYNWSGFGMTIGQGSINFTDDVREKLAWQNFSLADSSSEIWSNYTLDEEEQEKFVSATHNFSVRSYVDAAKDAKGNVTLKKLAYKWKHGFLFNPQQNLFVKVKTYVYTPMLKDDMLFIEGNSSKTTGGWGENYTFSVSVRDRFGRNVTVYAWHKKIIYEQIGNATCVNCAEWTQFNFSYKYEGSDMGTWYYKFNASNADGVETTAEKSYVIEEDDIDADFVFPEYNATINRSILTDFVINIYDKDNKSAPGYLVSGSTDEGKGKIYISKFGSNETFDVSPAISSNASGALIRSMENSSVQWCKTSDYYLGQNWWKGGVTGATRYKENITDIRPFMLIASLYNFYLMPQAVNYTSGSYITLEGYVKDDCNVNITDASVVFVLTSGSYTTEQTVFFNAPTATYRKTDYVLPSGAPLGWYNVTMKSSKLNHWNGTVKKENAFYYGSAIRLDDQRMLPIGGGGWGERPFIFSVNVTNNQTTTSYLWLWNASGWRYEYNESCAVCQNYNISYKKNFTCGNIGEWKFRYNASDVANFLNDSLAAIDFVVERDDIIVEHSSGNEAYINRSDIQPGFTARLATKINDTDLRTYTTDVSNDTELFTYIWNGTSYLVENELVNTSGVYYYLDFNPSCSYEAGKQRWNMSVEGAACYKNASSPMFNVTIIGDLNNTIIKPDGSTNFTRGDKILLNGSVFDDCNVPVTDAVVIFELVSSNQSFICNAVHSGDGYYNCTWDSSLGTAGYYNVTMKSSKGYHNNASVFKQNAFFLVGPVLLQNPTMVSSGDGSWGESYNFSVTVSHYKDVTVCLVEQPVGFAWTTTECKYIANPSNTLVVFNRTKTNKPYTCSDLKGADEWTWYYKFNASDIDGLGYNESVSQSHSLIKNDIVIIYLEGNENSVNRNGTETTKFVLFVNDTDKEEAVTPDARVHFNITWNGSEYRYDGNVTTTSGNATYYFNPECSPFYEVGKQKWFGYTSADTCYKDASSGIFNVTVIGDLFPNVTYPDNITFITGDIVNISGTVEDECFTKNITNAIVNFTLISSGTEYNCENVSNVGNGTYKCDWNSTGAVLGWYDIRMNASSVENYRNISRIKQNTFYLQPRRPLVIDRINLSHDVIYRNNSFSPNSTNITVHVNVSDEGDANNATVIFFGAIDTTCITDVNGTCSIIYNPSDTLLPGPYTIFMNATHPDPLIDDTNVTVNTTVLVKGILYVDITSPANGSAWARNESIYLNSSTKDENANILTGDATITIRWYNDTGLIFIGHNGTFSLAEQYRGYRLIIANASNESYDTSTNNITIEVRWFSDVVWAFPANASIQKYPDPFNISCLVRVSHTGEGISGYAVNFSYKTDGSFIYNGTYWTNASGYAVKTWYPFDKGWITYKCDIGDNLTMFYLKNVSSTYASIWIKDLVAPSIWNMSILPNTSIEANLNVTNITADVTDDYSVNATWASILMPNGSIVNISMFLISGNTYRGNYTPPIGGTYNVTIYARDQPPENNTNFTYTGSFDVWGKISGFINNTPKTQVASGITQTASFSFDLEMNFTNLGPATAYDINLTVFDPTAILNYNETSKLCGTLLSGQSCKWIVKVTVPAKTPPQLISIYSNATWRNPDNTWNSTRDKTEVSVSSNPILTISPGIIQKDVQHDKTTLIDTILISSTGNDGVTNILIKWLKESGNLGTNCPLCDVPISVTSYGYLAAGSNFTTDISVTVPAGQSPDIYWAYVRASSENAGYSDIYLNVTVLTNLSWTRTPETFGTVLSPTETTGSRNITLRNIGNVKIPLTVYVTEGAAYVDTCVDGTCLKPLGIDLEKQMTRNLTIKYPLGSPAPGTYYVNILIRNESATPPELTTNLTLNITDVAPTISDINISPQIFEIVENVFVGSKITDNIDVSAAWISVTRPDSSTLTQFMSKNDSYYNTTYSTTQAGNHSMKICANDTANLVACTDTTIIKAVGNTSLSIIPNQTSVEVRGITPEIGKSFSLNITTRNTGEARSHNTTLNISLPAGWTASPSLFDYATVLKNTSRSNVTTINIPAGTLPGTYYINLTTEWKNLDNTAGSNSTSVSVEIISRYKWIQTPSNISKEVVHNTEGFFGNITLNNTGEVYLVLNVSKTGNISDYISLNLSYAYLDIGKTETRILTYNVSFVSNITTFTGYIKTKNISVEAGTLEKETFLNLTVHPYDVDIKEPTQIAPIINVSYGDNITVKVNITYAGSAVENGIEFNLSLMNKTITQSVNISSLYNSTEKLWWLNFSAPNLTMGYDLNVTAKYTAKNITHYDIEGKAIIYPDDVSPTIRIFIAEENSVGSIVKITANITDSGGLNITKNVTAKITKPDNMSEIFNMPFVLRDWDVFVYSLDFTNTSQVGTYSINISAYDMFGNYNSTNKTFNVMLFLFNGTAIDEEDINKPALSARFEFYNLSGTIKYNFSSNAAGYYEQLIANGSYNSKIDIWNETIEFFSVQITSHFGDPVKFGKIKTKNIGKGSLTGISTETKLNFSLAKITFSYSQFTDITASNLGIYKCDSYTKYTGCGATWTRLGGTRNTTISTIYVNVTSLSQAYALAEYVCGNAVCESDYGESNANCPQDCQIVQVPPETVGGGGAAAAYVGGETGKIFVQVKDSKGFPANSANCLLTVYYPNNTIWINKQPMTYLSNSLGIYYYEFIAPKARGTYITEVNCTNPVAYGISSFQISQWAATIIETNEIVSAKKRIVIEGPVQVDAGKNYTAIIYYYNATDKLDNAPENIIVNLYDPFGNLNETKNATNIAVGKYKYEYITYNTSTGGNWKLEAKISDFETTSYWYLYSGPFDVKIIEITDNVLPDITAKIMLNNTGDPKDVTMYYWIEYINGTKVVTESESWFATSGVQYVYKTLNLQNPGTYVYKVLLRWAPYREAGSSLQFTAVSGELNISLMKFIFPDWILPKTKEEIIVNVSSRNTGGTDIVIINITDEIPFDFDPPNISNIDILFENSTTTIKLTSGYSLNISNIDADNNTEISLKIPNMSQTNIGEYLKPNDYIKMNYIMNSSEMPTNSTRFVDTNVFVNDTIGNTKNISITKMISSASSIIRAYKKITINPTAPTNASVEIIMKALGGNITEISLADYLPQGAIIQSLDVKYNNKTNIIYLYNGSDYLLTGPFADILPDNSLVDIYFYNFSYNFTNWDGTLYEDENITVAYNATILGGGTWILPAIVSGFDPQYKKFIRTEVFDSISVPLFDITIKILTPEVKSGNIVKASSTILNIGGPKVLVDVFLTYSVKTMKGKLITERSKTIAVLDKKEEELELKLPAFMSGGMYTFEVLATYSGREAMATDVFKVTGMSSKSFYIIAITAIIFVLLLIRFTKFKKRFKKRKINKNILQR